MGIGEKKIIAIIPARGGSKSIPRKNLVSFDGKPLVAHSIIIAQSSMLIDRVIVSTEDEEIANISKRFGAEVRHRPFNLAGDSVLDLPVFEDVLEQLDLEGYEPELIVHLRPTSPYRKLSWIDEAIQKLIKNKKADSVRSVSEPSQHPYRIFKINSVGYLDPIMSHEHPEPYVLRRQDCPKLFHYNCVIDVTRVKTIYDKKSMTGEYILPYVMDPDEVIDIDSPRDLLIAKSLFEGKK